MAVFRDYGLTEWLLTGSFVFGGCCSNALVLESFVTKFHNTGTLITFCQFLLISLFGLFRNLTIQPAIRTMPRTELLQILADHVLRAQSQKPNRIIRIAIDGVDGSGKTTFADELAQVLRIRSSGSPLPVDVIRASVDEFHNTPDLRYRKGRSSPLGFFLDSYDYLQLRQKLLEPLSPNGSKIYMTGIYDVRSGTSSGVLHHATSSSVLILDGIFLHREELISYWDLSIFLHVPSEISYERMAARDNTSPDPEAPANKRYLIGQSFYLTSTSPKKKATFCVDNSDLERPTLVDNTIRTSFLKKVLTLRLRKRAIPLRKWAFQVLLFLATSLLNNIAFRYKVPMYVHIVFRSGGSAANMLLGCVAGKRYSKLQVAAVAMVTCGVSVTAYSAIRKKEMMASSSSQFEYSVGILVLAVALILSALMGLEQDRVYGQYGRGHWEEALFYLHALALPMFAFTWTELWQELEVASHASSAPLNFVGPPLLLIPPEFAYLFAKWFPASITLSAFTMALSLIVMTQLFCIVGVHRLTSRVDSLSVSLVLAARKALSLAFSVLLLNGSWGNISMWTGATLVMLGSIAYSLSTGSSNVTKKKTD